MGDWLSADMNPDDPGSQGYNAEPIMRVEAQSITWFECPRCGYAMDLLPFRDDGPDREFHCPECDYRYAD